jgi:hypothetical protein
MAPSVPPKTSSGAQNMKTGPDALGITENESENAKHENGTRRPRYRLKRVRMRKTLQWDPTLSVQPKMSAGGKNIKTGPDALSTAQIESGSAKHENGTWCPLYHPKCSRDLKT